MLHILRGWINRFRKLPPELKKLFDERLSVCKTNECGMYKFGICTACGCPVKAKTKVLSEFCPENMWKPTIYEEMGFEFIDLSESPEWLREKFLLLDGRLVWYRSNLPDEAVAIEHWTEFLEDYEANSSSAASA